MTSDPKSFTTHSKSKTGRDAQASARDAMARLRGCMITQASVPGGDSAKVGGVLGTNSVAKRTTPNAGGDF
jgi:molybdenum cofactor biosynthesis enzyme